MKDLKNFFLKANHIIQARTFIYEVFFRDLVFFFFLFSKEPIVKNFIERLKLAVMMMMINFSVTMRVSQ